MKIIINENESYEIKIEEITLKSLVDLVDRLNNAFPSDKITAYVSGQTIVTNPRETETLINGFQVRTKRKYTKQNQKPIKTINKKPKKMNPKGIIPFRTNRDETIKVFKLHYFGTKEDKERYVTEINTNDKLKNSLTWNEDVVKSLSGLRKRFKITPGEVGIKEFPKTRGRNTSKEVSGLIKPKVEKVEKDEVEYY